MRDARLGLAALLVSAACGDNLLPAPAVRDAAGADAAPDASYVDPLGPWGAPTPLFATSLGDDDDPTLTADMLELYFNRSADIYVARRASVAEPFGTATLVAELSTAAFETTPEVSGDGLVIYFASDRPGGLGSTDIYVSTRASRAAAWGAPVAVAALNTTTVDGAAYVTADGRTAVIGTDRKAGTDHDLYLSTRADLASAWSPPVEIPGVNSPSADWSPDLSADGLTLYFVSYRSGGGDLYLAHRRSVSEPFSSPQPIPELDTAAAEADPWISPDGHHLVFTTDRGNPGTQSLYEAFR